METHAKPYKLTKSLYHDLPKTADQTGEVLDRRFDEITDDDVREIKDGLRDLARTEGAI